MSRNPSSGERSPAKAERVQRVSHNRWAGKGGTGRSTYVVGQEVGVSRWFESFANEISQMPETDEDHVADVRREQNVIRGILFLVVRDRFADGVLGGEAVILVCAMAKLRMDGIEDLPGCGGSGWVGKPVVIVVHLVLAPTEDAAVL